MIKAVEAFLQSSLVIKIYKTLILQFDTAMSKDHALLLALLNTKIR